MRDRLRVLSIYEGFFSGGARMLHTDAVIGLHEGGQRHRVLSIHGDMRREATYQRMEDDACYRSLSAAGVPVTSLGRRPPGTAGPGAFTSPELAVTTGLTADADVILSLKEQPIGLLNQAGPPHRPVVVCLHRSDPENQGAALDDLKTAVAEGRIAAAVCCAASTKAAYQAAGIPAGLLHVIPNGVDLLRFRPDPVRHAALRASLRIPSTAPVIVFAARYAAMKNVPLFLSAARSYLRQEPGGHILMCGAGMTTANPGLRADLAAAFADEPRLTDRVSLLGVRCDMEVVYAAADVVSLTSATGEAAPLCLIEGMMCGAVPVATDVGDCAAMVAGHGITTPPDPETIARAWSEAAGRRAEFAPALARSRERFSRTRMIVSYSALIDRVHRDAAEVALAEPF
ncbi:glycosyltransferase involved in cell wall biosynthesis [Streptacidiphilus sp. MAP12-16]|uniref:glycosyltransferase n=1 Tax=Streptacidiphilus sp. MAP12-16 TaxID=3156300 RepID=UPI00351765BB